MQRIALAALLLLTTPATASDLLFMGRQAPPAGEKSTVTITGEGTCTYHKHTPPELIIGAGAVQPLMLPGSYGHGTAVPTPSSLADTNTVGGIAIRIPLTRSTDKCKDFHTLQKAKSKLQLAAELLKADQISQDEFNNIAQDAYAVIKR